MVEASQKTFLGVYASSRNRQILTAAAHHLAERMGYSIAMNPDSCFIAYVADAPAQTPTAAVIVHAEETLKSASAIWNRRLPQHVSDLFRGAIRAGGLLEVIGRILLGSISEPAACRAPWVDLFEDHLIQSFSSKGRENGRTIPTVPPWPDGRAFAVGLSHDVDRIERSYQLLTHPVRLLLRGKTRGAAAILRDKVADRDDFWGFPTILAIEQEFGVKSTWFWLNETRVPGGFWPWNWKRQYGRYRWSDPRVREMIIRLAREGHEVALHNSLASTKRPQLNWVDRRTLARIADSEVRGCRQHYLNLDLRTGWHGLQDAGFAYDSSVGFADHWGFRLGTASPFHPVLEGAPLDVLELPMTVMDRSVGRAEPPELEVRAIIEAVRAARGCLIANWHSNVFGRYYEGFVEAYRNILAEAVRHGAWVATLSEIATWWEGRSTQRLSPEDQAR